MTTSSSSLLRRNRNYRLLWLGQVVSQLGDWFNAVAVYALLLELTGSATAVAWMMVVQLLPLAVFGPLAGVIADRIDRVRLMIAADLVRGVAILGLLVVRGPGDVWIAYAVMATAVMATAFFEPARSATIPSVVERADLIAANAIGTATWSAVLAIGAALGGAVTAFVGRDAAFAINSLSFFGSALFLSRIRLAARRSAEPRPDELERVGRYGDLVEGLSYLRRHGAVAALTFVKAGWALAGGAVLLLTVFGQRVFPLGQSAAAGIGVLYAARGVGAGLGAVLTRFTFQGDSRQLRRIVGPMYFMCGACYALLGFSTNLWFAAASVVGAHVAGALLWVASSVLLQLAVPDQLRGRVFAVELMLLALMSSFMSWATAAALDRLGLSPQALAKIIGLLFCLPGIAWFVVDAALRRQQALAASGDVPASPVPPAVLE